MIKSISAHQSFNPRLADTRTMISPRSNRRFLRPGYMVVLLWLTISSAVHAQTLALTNDSQTFTTLTGTTVTMTGRSELRITGTTTPITGSIIHLNSPDSWFFMTGVRPSVVNSTYLGQIRVNGAAAVLNTNCRVVQYGEGTVVVPHASTFAPLQVFTGSHFTGTSVSLQNYTAYNDASLGAYANKISSFKLKRGYTATVAQNSNGTGVSRNYVAQDGDIEVSVLPAALNDSISFVRVFPWRWVSKKGSCDIDPTALNASWHYNWNIDKNSAMNWEYVAIKQQPNWPSLAQNWQTRGINTVLGLNEPNNPVEDAYQNLVPVGSVSDAVTRMPDLLGTGLRVGAPAVTDGGYSWIVDFVNQANAAGHRLDFVPVHYYRSTAGNNPQTAANSMYNFLKSIHDATGGRPIWVTEFNNGANWTDNAHDPTAEQNRNVVEAMINMMDATPWIERYSVYSRVEWFRQTHYDDGFITPMGTMYRDHVSPMAYQQVIPEVPTTPSALYQFENDARDSSGNGHAAMLKGGAKFTTGKTARGVVMSGVAASGDCVQLSTRLGDSTDFTFGGWVYWDGGANWQRIFDLGSGTTRYMFVSPAAGSGNLRFAIAEGGAEQQLNHNAPLPLNTWTHVAVTISGNTGKLFLNGAPVASNNSMTFNPVNLGTSINFLGKSQFPADPLFAGKLDDVQFLAHALTDSQVLAMATNTPPQFVSANISGGNATQGVAYSGTIAGSATDADVGDTITYSKASGADWLLIAANGTLTGTPSADDSGIQEFVVNATDTVGASAVAVLTIQLPTIIGNGTWSSDSSGNWSETARWTGGFPANGTGNTANFSALNITADRTVTLDSSRSIGTLQFGDTSGAQNWTLAAANGRDLTLAVASGSPSIQVNQNTATITASLDGTAGFTKSGAGALVLNGENPLTGTLNVDVGSTTDNSGSVRLASPNAATGLTGIQIRNNNSGSSTLELDGTTGAVTTPAGATISLSGRGGAVPAVRNIAGTNTLAGTITLQSGGGNYVFHSDAGTLNLNGALTSNAPTTTRSVTFQGAGNINLNGVLSNGTTTAGVGIIKNHAGMLALTGSNTFSGNITINSGVLSLLNGGSVFAGGWNNTTVVSINSGGTLELDRWGYGPTNATYRTQSLGGLDYGPARLVINGGTISYSGGAAGAPQNPGEAPYGPGFTIGANGATLNAAKSGDVWTVKFDSRGTGDIASAAGGTLTLTGIGDGILDKVLPGAGGLIKSGPGTWILPRVNSYTGTTTVSGGTLLVTGTTSTGSVAVGSTATLGGNGTIGGTVTVQSGGTMAPGVGIGKLTITGPLFLQSGSTTRMEINKSAATRDVLAVTGNLTYGGTLIVTNLAGTLAAGDSFSLFEGGAKTGAFSTLTLPALNPGLAWDTSSLSSGIIGIHLSPSTYSGWAGGYVFPEGKGGPEDDADGDGMVNALEWLFGSDPLAPDLSFLPQPSIRSLSAAEYPAAVAGKTYLTMTARVRKTHTGMTLVPQANSSLETLDTPASAGLVTSFLVNDLGLFEERTWIHTQAIEDSPGGRGFMRLKLIGD